MFDPVHDPSKDIYVAVNGNIDFLQGNIPEVFHLGDENVLWTMERPSNIANIIHHRNSQLFTGKNR